MPAALILLVLGMIIGLDFFPPMRVLTYDDQVGAQTSALAWNLGLYEQAAKSYVRDNPATVGQIPDPTAYYPSGYTKKENWVAYRNATGQMLITSVGPLTSTTIPAGRIARVLQQLQQGPLGVGVVSNNVIISAVGYAVTPGTGLAIPSVAAASVDLSTTGWVVPNGQIAVLTAQ